MKQRFWVSAAMFLAGSKIYASTYYAPAAGNGTDTEKDTVTAVSISIIEPVSPDEIKNEAWVGSIYPYIFQTPEQIIARPRLSRNRIPGNHDHGREEGKSGKETGFVDNPDPGTDDPENRNSPENSEKSRNVDFVDNSNTRKNKFRKRKSGEENGSSEIIGFVDKLISGKSMSERRDLQKKKTYHLKQPVLWII